MTSFTNTTTNYPQEADTAIRRVKRNHPPGSVFKNFILGDEWLDTSSSPDGTWWKLSTLAAGGKVWVIMGGGAGVTETLTGNSGGPVPPSGSNINVIGDGTSINVVGNPGTNTLTISVAAPLPVADGGTGATTLTGVLIGHGTSAVTGNPVTQFDVLVGGASNAITSVSPSTAGLVLTSNGTSANPTFQAISASGAVTSLAGDTGTATPNAGVITVSGGTTGLTTTGSVHTLTLGGILGIANGGTDATSFTQTNGIVTYNGTRLVNYAGPQISSAGVYTNTSQPCFMVYLTTAVPAVSGDNTNYPLLYDTTQFDQASNITLNSGSKTIFTAPVTGKYLFCGCINFNWTMGSGNASVISQMVVSSGTIYRITEINQFEPGETSGETFSLIIPMTASQTVYLETMVNIAGGGKTAAFRGIEGGITMNFWSGDLLC